MPGTGRRQGHISGCKPDSRPGAPGTQTVVVPVSAAATWRPCPLALLPASRVSRAGPMSTFPAPHILSPGPTPRGQRSCCRRGGEREAKNERKERRSGRRPIMILLLAYFFSFQFHASDFQCHRKQRGAGHDIYITFSLCRREVTAFVSVKEPRRIFSLTPLSSRGSVAQSSARSPLDGPLPSPSSRSLPVCICGLPPLSRPRTPASPSSPLPAFPSRPRPAPYLGPGPSPWGCLCLFVRGHPSLLL